METTGLSNNIGYRPDATASPNIEQKPKLSVEQQKPVEVQPEEVKREVLEVNLEKVNTALTGYGLGVNFSRDADTNRPIVRIVDLETNEVIKQYPNEGALALMKNIQNYLMQQSGSTLNKQELTGALLNETI